MRRNDQPLRHREAVAGRKGAVRELGACDRSSVQIVDSFSVALQFVKQRIAALRGVRGQDRNDVSAEWRPRPPSYFRRSTDRADVRIASRQMNRGYNVVVRIFL